MTDLRRSADHMILVERIESEKMDLHAEIINIQVEKKKQNIAIDDAMKKFKSFREILVAVYTMGHRDARHKAAEVVNATQRKAN